MAPEQKDFDQFGKQQVAEQTFLTWMQTSLSLIGLGFALGSVIALMQSEHYERFIVQAIRIIGQLLIVVGVLSMVLALLQHRSKIKSIKAQKEHHDFTLDISLITGVLVSLLGIAAFLAILMHMIF